MWWNDPLKFLLMCPLSATIASLASLPSTPTAGAAQDLGRAEPQQNREQRLNSQLFSFKIEFWNSWQRQWVKTIALNKQSADRRAGFPALHQTKIFLERKKKQRAEMGGEGISTLPTSSWNTASGDPREGEDVPSFLSRSPWGFLLLSWRQNRGCSKATVNWGPRDQSQDS